MYSLDKYDKVVELVQEMKEDYDKIFIRSNKTAGTRVRQKAQDIKSLLNEIRDDVQVKKGIRD